VETDGEVLAARRNDPGGRVRDPEILEALPKHLGDGGRLGPGDRGLLDRLQPHRVSQAGEYRGLDPLTVKARDVQLDRPAEVAPHLRAVARPAGQAEGFGAFQQGVGQVLRLLLGQLTLLQGVSDHPQDRPEQQQGQRGGKA
jgi:hypothetical protein